MCIRDRVGTGHCDMFECVSHNQRENRKKLIKSKGEGAESSQSGSLAPEHLRLWDITTKELELIMSGQVVCVPVEEVRYRNLPEKRKGSPYPWETSKKHRNEEKGAMIHNFTEAETPQRLREELKETFNKAVANAELHENMTNEQAKVLARKETQNTEKFNALKDWEDVQAEIKVKESLKDLLEKHEIPGVIVRSLETKKLCKFIFDNINNLKNNFKVDVLQIDTLMAFASGSTLNIYLAEVKLSLIHI